MGALSFEVEPPVVPSAPNRMDVACFVGYVGIRRLPSGTVAFPDWLSQWLLEQGWLAPAAGIRQPHARDGAAELLDVPVPIEAWSTFDRLFAWEQRAVAGSSARAATYLGAAVRSFFGEGGRKCYVIRVGEPWPLASEDTPPAADADRAAERILRLAPLIPGFPGAVTASPADRSSWRGAAHLFGLPDVSFLCCPDLGDIVRAGTMPADRRVTLPLPPEGFLECSEPEPLTDDSPVRRLRAPRCDEQGYAAWTRALEVVRDMVQDGRCETQLVAAVPLPLPGSIEEGRFLERFTRPILDEPQSRRNRGNSYVQLTYPWLQSRASADLPEGLAGADGTLAGLLARNALTRGTYRSAAGVVLSEAVATYPALPQAHLAPIRRGGRTRAEGAALAERVSLVGRTVRGMRLLSDVTLSGTERYRPASLHRLLSAIVRAAQRIGHEIVFESSGERLWARLRSQLEGLLGALYQEGALRGATPDEAFRVRCDRTTMTQSDIDAGRVIAHVEIDPAAPIDAITVVLALDAAGELALLSLGVALEEVA